MTEAVAKANYKWRVVDIVVAAIIAVASGVIFWGWDIVCSAPLALFEGVTPGFEGLLNGFWLFAARSLQSLCASPVPHCLPKPSPPSLSLRWDNVRRRLADRRHHPGSGCRNCLRRLRLEEVEHRHHHPVRCARRRGLLGLLLGHQPGLERPARHLVSGGLHHLRRRDRGVVVWYLSRALAVTGALERFESGRSKARV